MAVTLKGHVNYVSYEKMSDAGHVNWTEVMLQIHIILFSVKTVEN